MADTKHRADMIRIIDTLMSDHRLLPEVRVYSQRSKTDVAITALAKFLDSIIDEDGYALIDFQDLNDNNLTALQRWRRFMQTDLDYQWPDNAVYLTHISIKGGLGQVCLMVIIFLLMIYPLFANVIEWYYFVIISAISAITFALITLKAIRENALIGERRSTIGDFEYWPFLSSNEYRQVI